jgi:hypothetical protein
MRHLAAGTWIMDLLLKDRWTLAALVDKKLRQVKISGFTGNPV